MGGDPGCQWTEPQDASGRRLKIPGVEAQDARGAEAQGAEAQAVGEQRPWRDIGKRETGAGRL